MNDDIEDVESKVRERVRKIREAVLLFPRVAHAVSEIRNLHNMGVTSHRSECIVLYGQSGAGKTHLLNFYRSEYPHRRVRIEDPSEPATSGTRIQDDVIFVETPSPATRKGLIDRIQAAMEPEPLPIRLTLVERRERLITMLRNSGISLLIVDEFQHLIDRRSRRVVQEASDLIKSLLNAAICPIVLSGTPEILEILREDSQLKSRVYSNPSLSPFEWDYLDDREQFFAYLTEIEESLNFEEASNLAEPHCAQRIHFASRGLIGETARLLSKSADIATRAGLSRISIDCLAQAFDYAWILSDAVPKNPFREAKLPTRQIDYR